MRREAQDRFDEQERKDGLKQAALEELEGMVGFGVAKEFVRKLVLKVRVDRERGAAMVGWQDCTRPRASQ